MELVTFETATLADEKKSDGRHRYHFDSRFLTPTVLGLGGQQYGSVDEQHFPEFLVRLPEQSVLQKWLREVHNIHIIIEPAYDYDKDNNLFYNGLYNVKVFNVNKGINALSGGFKTYEEALEFGLERGLHKI